MTVNFDGLRSQLAYAYDGLTQILNRSIIESKKDYGDDHIRISPDEIQEEMDDLRSRIMVLCCCYEEGDDGFKDISEEVKPIAYFNPADKNEMPTNIQQFND
jgi:hypothetical protein